MNDPRIYAPDTTWIVTFFVDRSRYIDCEVQCLHEGLAQTMARTTLFKDGHTHITHIKTERQT